MKKEFGAQVISKVEASVGFDKIEYQFYGVMVKFNKKSIKVNVTREVMMMNGDTFMDKKIEKAGQVSFWLDRTEEGKEVYKNKFFGIFKIDNEAAKSSERLTEKEEKVLRAIIKESNFNINSLDITKSWNEQILEDPETFWAFADVNDYGCGMSKAQTRAIFGSLVKKNLISITEDDNGENVVSWITIDEKQFNSIKAMLG